MCGSAHLPGGSVDTRAYDCVRELTLGLDVVYEYVWLSGNGEDRYPLLNEPMRLDGRIGTMLCYLCFKHEKIRNNSRHERLAGGQLVSVACGVPSTSARRGRDSENADSRRSEPLELGIGVLATGWSNRQRYNTHRAQFRRHLPVTYFGASNGSCSPIGLRGRASR